MKFVQQKIFSKIKYITLIIVGILPLHAFAQNLPGIATTGDRLISSLGPIGQLSIGILYTLMTLVAGLLGIAGLILNGILKISVTDLSTRLSISSIETTWRVLRDLANMSFIFILLYEGIRMILGLEGSNVKKVLSGIIIAAILINFSLFATKVVIDASNIITLGFYNSIVSAGDTSTGLSGMLMNVLRRTLTFLAMAIVLTACSTTEPVSVPQVTPTPCWRSPLTDLCGDPTNPVIVAKVDDVIETFEMREKVRA